MLREYNDSTFDEQVLHCGKCQWTGKGHEAVIVDLYGLVNGKEVHCPSCDEKLGIVKSSDSPPGENASDLSFQLG